MKKSINLLIFSTILLVLFLVSSLSSSISAVATEPQQPTCLGGNGIDTAIGCINFSNQTEIVGFFVKWSIGIGGGIAFLLIVYSGFMIMTSQGNPERLKAGQELLGAAISGLLLLIFAVFMLRIIGYNILNIPGFAQP